MKLISSVTFEQECNDKLLCWLWDEALNPTHQTSITLTVAEMRVIANLLRDMNKRPRERAQAFTEEKADASMRDKT